MDLTVLTPSIPERREWLRECMDSVQVQTVPVKRHVVSVGQIPAVEHQNLLRRNVETEWFSFLADDDWWYPTLVERVQDCIELAPQVKVWSPWVDEDFPYNQNIFIPELLEMFCTINGAAIVHRSLLDLFEFPDYSGHDWAVWQRVAKNLKDPRSEIGYVAEPLMHYRIHDGQISRTDPTDPVNGLPEEFR